MRGFREVFRYAAPVLLVLPGLTLTTPARADTVVAAPTQVTTTNDFSSVTLTWTAPRTGSPATSFRVYEGGTVVARNTTTHVTVRNLGYLSTHTFTVTAVDAAGQESAPSIPVTRWV